MSNARNTSSTGLFDVSLSSPPDSWHFICVLTPDAPHDATCTLTYETPLRPEGPAWLKIRFRVAPSHANRSLCVASGATLVGTYFYDALTNDAGVYAFQAAAV